MAGLITDKDKKQQFGIVPPAPKAPIMSQAQMDMARALNTNPQGVISTLEAEESDAAIRARDKFFDAYQKAVSQKDPIRLTNGSLVDSDGASVAANQPLEPAEKIASTQDWRKTLFDNSDYGKQVAALQSEHDDIVGKSADQKRQEEARKRLAAVTDAISSVANLYGVTKGGYNQAAPMSTKMLSDRIISDRRLREANIRDLRKRLDDGYRALMQMGLRSQEAENAARRLDYYANKEERLREQGDRKLTITEENNKRTNDTRLQTSENTLEGRKIAAGATVSAAGIRADASKYGADKRSETAITTQEMRNSAKSDTKTDEKAKKEAVSKAASDWDKTKNAASRKMTGKDFKDVKRTENQEFWDAIQMADTEAKRKKLIEDHPEWFDIDVQPAAPKAEDKGRERAEARRKNPYGDNKEPETAEQAKERRKQNPYS